MAEYDGPVVFTDGVHYPANEDGTPDTARPLRFVGGALYRDAVAEDPPHNDIHHEADLVVEPGSEG